MPNYCIIYVTNNDNRTGKFYFTYGNIQKNVIQCYEVRNYTLKEVQMANKITEIPFTGTPEQEAKLKEVIAAHKGQDGAMMPVLQQAQEIYGYLPIEVQTMIAEGLGCSLEQVYGVATFYSWFSLEPKGKHLIRVCMGTACYVKGSADILAELERQLGIKAGHTTNDGLFTLEATRCLGCCGLAPVIVIDDDVFGRLVPADIKGVLDKYRD